MISMPESNPCPNCGSQMDVGDLFLRGKAACQKCGFKGMPLSESDYAKKAKARMESATGQPDPLDTRGLLGKLVIVMAGMLVLSIALPEMRSFAPVSVLGMLLFGLSYKFIGRR